MASVKVTLRIVKSKFSFLRKFLRSLRSFGKQTGYYRLRSMIGLGIPVRSVVKLREANHDASMTVRTIDDGYQLTCPASTIYGEPEYALFPHQVWDIPSTLVAKFEDAHVWGYFDGALVTKEGSLVAETSFDMYGPELHRIYTQLRLPKAVKLEGNTLYLGCQDHANYYHWTTDFITRLLLIESQGTRIRDFDHVIMRPPTTGFHREIYNYFGITSSQIREFTVKDLFLCDHVTTAFTKRPMAAVHQASIELLRTLPHADLEQYPRKLYLRRNGKFGRFLRNDAEISELCEQFGFTVVVPDELSPEQQRSLFAKAEIIIGVHGASFSNLVFSKNCTHVIELMPRDYADQSFYWITAAIKAKHIIVLGVEGTLATKHTTASTRFNSFSIDPALLKECLTKEIGALP